VVEGTHWTSDMVGGAWPAACILAAACASGWVPWSNGHRRAIEWNMSIRSHVVESRETIWNSPERVTRYGAIDHSARPGWAESPRREARISTPNCRLRPQPKGRYSGS
jgi:hypothetical protein